MRFLLFLLTTPLMAFAAPGYQAEKTKDHGIDVVRLVDGQRGVEVSVAPGLGMRGYEMKVHGKNILYFPLPDVSALETSRGLNGIPFLAPWANRMAGSGFWANDKHYKFNPDLGVMRIDQNGISIHGLLSASKLWKVAEVRTAVALSDEQRSRLAQALSQATGKSVEVKVIVDETVLGGIVARIGDTVSVTSTLRGKVEF